MRSIELFAGAGGLGIGVGNAGFNPLAVIEWDKYCCDTIRDNQRLEFSPVRHWPLFEGDVRDFDFREIKQSVDLVSGGPPCQPFSLGGKHRGHTDTRDMFPHAIRAVRELRPRAFILENVKGLTREAFATYLEYIRLQLTYPNLVRRGGEQWADHLGRLERQHTAGRATDLQYQVVMRVLNAADYGVPQRRERIFIVGIRGDIGIEWSFPEQTHASEALSWSQWRSGDYWDEHKVARRHRSIDEKAKTRTLAFDEKPRFLRWRTVRDALAGLPDPERDPHLASNFLNHRFQPGARSYIGHTGSPLDEPAKTLKAGDHGVPGGENMLLRPDGSIRYFSVRESARLQTFPDEFRFHGSWTETMRQLGNAVPVTLAQIVARSVRALLEKAS
jgi:DNA (cytosine-5)-methyltransferase 1